MNTQRFLIAIYGGLLALLITGTAFAGRYQRTKDGRTRVWNENPKPGDSVTWSGARDAKGYATGYGTLTWFTPANEVVTGSHIARERHYVVSSRQSGIMVHGRFEEAPADVTSNKKKRKRVSEQEKKAPAAQTEPTAKPKGPAPTPAPEKAVSAAATPTPALAAPSPTPASDSLDSLMHAPSSLKLGSPVASPSPAIPSASGTPDVSLQLAAPASPSPSP